MTKVDLHLHTNYSDGSDTPTELLNCIKKEKIGIFALTDHDTIEGCKEIINKVPKNIKFLPSTELTCTADDIKCHILGYNCNLDDEKLNNLIEKGKLLRRNKLEVRINYLKNTWGIKLNKEELDWLYTRKSVVKTHIANILVNRNLASDNVSAMKKYLNGCKAGDTRFTIEEALEAINSAGGIPVWAHPLGGEGEEHDNQEEFLPKLYKMKSYGIKGLECYYSRYTKKEISFLVECANNNDLYITGGSDYHGTNKTIPISMLNTQNEYIDSELLTVLKYC